MKIIEQRFLRGPNLWTRKACLLTVLDLGDMACALSSELPGFGEDLLSVLPGLRDYEHALRRGSFVAEVIGQVTLELQRLAGAGPDVRFAITMQGKHKQVKIIVAYRREPLALQAFDAAMTIVAALCAGENVDVAGHVAALQANHGGAAAVAQGRGEERIPVLAVTGSNGKSTTTLMIAHCARLTGMNTGVTTSDGVRINRRQIVQGDCANFDSARVLLAAPEIDIAVLETAHKGILDSGLAFERCTVAVILNAAGGQHMDGLETMADVAALNAVVARCASRAVVHNADDANCLPLDGHGQGVERIYFSMEPENPVLLRHLEQGGRAAYLQDDALVLANGARRGVLIRAVAMPSAMHGHARHNIANGLAAAAALMGAGFTHAQIATGLSSFVSDRTSTPLRSNVYRARGVTILVDYAHNRAAYGALAGMARSLAAGRCLAVVSAPGERHEADLADIGRSCGAAFDELFVYEADAGGRPHGATAAAIMQGAQAAAKDPAMLHAIVPVSDAFSAAMARCLPGDVLVFTCGSVAIAARETARYVDSEPLAEAPSSPTPRPVFGPFSPALFR